MKDSLNNGSTFALLAVAAASAWVVKGLLAETRDRAGRRIADWLFPLGHPTTYRLARLTLAFAQLFAAHTRTSLQSGRRTFRLSEEPPLLPRLNPKLRHEPLDWDDLEAAAAELEVDQRKGAPIAKPLPFVAPLLLRALSIRLENCSARGAFVVGILVVRPIAIAVLLALRLLGWILRIPWALGAAACRQIDLWVAGALFRSAVSRLPEDMGEEERDFWIKAMYWDIPAIHQRYVLTTRFAVNLWIKRRLVLPDRTSFPKFRWAPPRSAEQTRTELLCAGDEVQFHVLRAAGARERRRIH